MKTLEMYRLIILILVIAMIIGCQPREKLIPGENYAEVTGGKVWYRIVGEGDKTPLLLLHGGPGVPSYYLNPLAALSKDRPVIFFDQLGCGRSDHNIDTSMMTVKDFVEQLEQLKTTLGLKEFYLYGQSWGTMLGVDYYLAYPDGIKALILSSPAISVPMWLRDADTLIATLPDSIQTAIRTNVRNGTYDSPEYQQAISIYYQNFVARKVPWSADIDSSFAQMNEEIYQFMWGPSEFTATGSLIDYDRTNRLSEIKIPTLFITGEFDEARPSTVQYYQSLVPNSKFVMIENAAHVTMHDNPQQDIKVINDFLSELEKK
nr:proline iminopeptidase-family hydrolase [Bacteroidota bacterium]